MGGLFCLLIELDTTPYMEQVKKEQENKLKQDVLQTNSIDS